jgi:hypothetical protein
VGYFYGVESIHNLSAPHTFSGNLRVLDAFHSNGEPMIIKDRE